MKIFISWAGPLSRQVADLLAKWIPEVLQNAKPWVSTQNLDKGRVWTEKIFKELNESNFGISCVTKDNRSAAWLLFEAGALCKGLPQNFLCPLAIDLNFEDVDQPLAAFNMTKPTKDDMLRLIKTINSSKPETALSDERVISAFDRCWLDFEEPFKRILASSPHTASAKRDPDDVMAEVLQLSRATQRSIEQLAAKSETYLSSLSFRNPYDSITPLLSGTGPTGPGGFPLLYRSAIASGLMANLYDAPKEEQPSDKTPKPSKLKKPA